MNNEGGSSINSVSRGRGGRNSRGRFGRGGGRDSSVGGGWGGGFGRGFNGGCVNPSRGGNNSIDKHPTCQVCKKKGHNADWCCHRFDEEYVPRRGLLRWPLVTTAGTLILELWIT
jgi:hypothetical protein